MLALTDLVRAWKQDGSPGGRQELLLRLARSGVVYVPRFYDVDYLSDGRIRRVVPNEAGVPWRVAKHTVSGPRRVAVPEATRWFRWRRPSTSGRASRSSAGAPAAAGSARPA